MSKNWFVLWAITLAILGLSLFAGSLALVHTTANADAGFSCNKTQISEKECEALLALYASTAGDNWANNSGWLKNDEPCRWNGVMCETVDQQRSVTKLHLEDNNLKGSLPAELGNLQNLRHLDLSRNKLEDSIPLELGVLGKLQHLNLTDNLLTGDIPPELGNLANLHFLWLTKNRLEGTIPAELGKLESLMSLFLDDNDLAGGLPAELGDLSTARRIFVDHNELVGSLPLTLSKLNQIEYFWFHSTSLCIPDSPQLANWLVGIDHLRTSEIDCAGGDPATLVITKTVVGPAPETDWSFSGSGAIGDFSLHATGGTTTYSLMAGTYGLSETVQSGYMAEVACTDGRYAGKGSINIDLSPGVKAGCTFTNTAQPARLTIIKKVSGPEPAADWEFSGSEEIVDFSLPAAGGSEVFTVTAGTHNIIETVQDHYTATVACTDGSTGNSTVSVDLGPGDQVSCTFTNKFSGTPPPHTGSVQGIVFEDVDGNNLPDLGEGIADAMVTMTGAAQPDTLVGTSAGVITAASIVTRTTSTGVDGIYNFDDVPVGDYIIAVAPPAGYVVPDITTITVLEGQTATVEPIAAQKGIPNEQYHISLPIVKK